MNKRILTSDYKPVLPQGMAGLARSHRLIMIERQRELQFLRLCEQIRVDDFAKDRSRLQREERKKKRAIKKAEISNISTYAR